MGYFNVQGLVYKTKFYPNRLEKQKSLEKKKSSIQIIRI